MNNKRNKRGPVRTQRNRPATAEGVYSNSHFVFSAASQLGTIVQIQTRNEDVYEGILKTFSNNFEVVLELATLISKNDVINPNGKIGIPNEIFIFRPNDIVSLTIKDTDPQFATRDNHFQTDSAISARLNGATNKEEKELEPWEGELNGTDTPLELDSSANGWDPNDMFKKNEQEYGVTSTFDHSLRGYTVALQHSDSADYKEAEAKANQIANEIEGNPTRKARLELENGDEEAAFASVVRPSTESNGKYIPPAKRKNQAKSGTMARTSPPPPPATAVPTTNSGNVAANGSASSSPSPNAAQVSPTGQYPNNVPAQLQQPNIAQTQMAPITQSQIQPQMAVPQPTQPQLPAVQQAQAPVVQQQQPQSSHQPQRQNHGYGNRQGQKGQHMNGESGKMNRGPRNVYQSAPPPAQHPQQPAQHALNSYQEVQPRMVEMNHTTHNNGRHHRDEVKDLQQFSQDFQLAAKDVVAPQQVPEQQVLPQCPQPSQHNLKVQSEVPPASSPPAEEEGAVGVDKVTTALKKSTLNPNAKEFVLNPTAKPFQPRLVINNNINRNEDIGSRHISSNFYRAPSASSQISRPQTPLTPSNPHYMSAQMNGQMPPQQQIVYMMSGGQPAFPQQPQGTRMRKMPGSQIRGGECMSHMSPMVAAATGQPLLTSHPPMLPYQTFGHAYQQMVRLQYPTQEVQYSQLAAPAGGQLNQYAPNQSAQVQVPPQQYTAPPPPQAGIQTQFVCANMPLQPHMMPQYMPPVPPHLSLTLMQNQHHPMHQGGPPA